MLADGTHPNVTGRFRSQSITSASGSVGSNMKSPLTSLSTLPDQVLVKSPPKARSLALPMQSMAISSNGNKHSVKAEARDIYQPSDDTANEHFIFSTSMPSKAMFNPFASRTSSARPMLSTSAPVNGSLDAMMAPARARMLKRKRRQSKTARDPSYNDDGPVEDDDDASSSDFSTGLDAPPVVNNRLGVFKAAMPPELSDGLETLVEIDDMELDADDCIDPALKATTTTTDSDFGTNSGITSGSSSRGYTPVTTTPQSGTDETALSILLLKAVDYASRHDQSIANAPLPTRDLSPAPIAHRAIQMPSPYASSGYGLSSLRATHQDGTTSRRASF